MMLRSGWGLLSLALVLVSPACLAAQPRSVTIRISDGISGLPLRNAEVIDRASGRSRMTDDSGTVHLDWRDADPVPIRVRQVGYRFADTVLTRSDIGGIIAIPLSRVAYALPALPVTTRCFRWIPTRVTDCRRGGSSGRSRCRSRVRT